MKTVSLKAIADVLRLPKTEVAERAKTEKWLMGGKTSYIEQRLPVDIRLALNNKNSLEVFNPIKKDIEENQQAYVNANEKQKTTANWRSALILLYKQSDFSISDFVDNYNAGHINSVLLAKLGQISTPTFYRWVKAFNDYGAAGIVPQYGQNRGGAGVSLSEMEKTYLRHFWLTTTQPSVMHALRLMKANISSSICTYQTALRYLNSISPVERDYYRKGPGRFENSYLPYMEQNINLYKSLTCVVSDHHCLDCVVMYRGKLIRPWLTTMQDYRSGKVLGWCVCVAPSSLSIIVAYYMAVIQYGIPETLLFDNGKDYHSKLLNGHTEAIKVFTPEGIEEEQEVYFTGVFNNIGSTVKFTRVYNGKSKGRQERYFRIIGEYLAKDIGTYVGSDSRSRPEESQLMFRSINGMEQRHDIPEYADFVQAAADMIRYINDEFICSGKGCEGKTRSQVFDEEMPNDVRHASKEMLTSALVRGDVRKCGRNGVKIGGINFYHPDLFEYTGQDVIVRASLVIDNQVQVFAHSGKFICTAYGDFFKESGALDADIARLEHARKKSLTAIAERGINQVSAAPEYQTMLDVAGGIYGNQKLPDVDEVLGLPNKDTSEELPKAVGQSSPVYQKTDTEKKQSKLSDPFMVTDDSQYL